MPGMIACCRRWYVSTDDWVYPSCRSILLYGVGLTVVAIVFTLHQDGLESCEDLKLVRIYYIGMMVLLTTHILVSMLLCACSMQGAIIDIRRRRSVPVVLYVKAVLFLPEIIWLLVGTYWAFWGSGKGCTGVVVMTVKALVLVGWVMFLSMLVGVVVVFDPLGHRRRRGHALISSTGSFYMDRNTDGAGAATKQLWETRCKLICCCAARGDENSNNAFNDIAQLFTNFFEGLDLVPTDIAAGLILVQKEQLNTPVRHHRTRLVLRSPQSTPTHPNNKLSKKERKQLKDRNAALQHAKSVDPEPTADPWVLRGDVAARALERSISAPVAPSSVLVDLSTESSPLVSPVSNTNSNANSTLEADPASSSESAVSSPVPVNRSGTRHDPKGWMSIHNATHYMRFAMASYGWPLYMYTNLTLGLCKLWAKCRCCCQGSQNASVHHDNPCQCHTAAIHNFTGVEPEDIIYASFHNAIYQIPFYVALDHSRSAIIISIRGTLSFRDALTDLTAECQDMHIPGVESPCKAHKGIVQAASYVHRMLMEESILQTAFTAAPTYQLYITGHSLGAGAASLLAITLRPSYPNLKCFAFSPPGGLLSKSLARYTEEFICSVVLGHDLVPRLGIVSMEDLKTQVLRCIKDSHRPKYKILAGGLWHALCGLPRSEDDGGSTRQPLLENQVHLRIPCYGSREETLSERQLEEAILTSGRSRQVNLALYPPGQIMYIEEDQPGSTCCGQAGYTAAWASAEVFSEVLVSPKMLTDHMPDGVFKALTQLADKNFHLREVVQMRRESLQEGLI